MFLRTMLVALGTILFAQTVTGVPNTLRRVQGLHSRSLVVPAACQGICSPFAPFLAGAACPVTECCTTIFEAGYFECFECVGNSTHATDYSIAQEYVDVITTSCLTEGFTLPELTFPGQKSDRALATALPAGFSIIPVFAPSAPSGSASGAPTVSGSAPGAASSTSGVAGSATGGPSGSATGLNPTPVSPSSISGLSFSGVSSGPSSQSTVTSPPSQSTATSPPSASAPSSSSTPSNAAARSRIPFSAVVALFAVIAVEALLV
ncbi:hypothetical protein DFH07DRAFT_813325 [Mycena maculata]|uniref:Extracellular membrane protein CFEM domain-containing protein n=1 Tax=Mycena maculata TaxID=230809 RepID=A0AAD7JG72_9AGAR|nr:hypothetical protein DFH07DRAFT_813325 [Mycena maculata]